MCPLEILPPRTLELGRTLAGGGDREVGGPCHTMQLAPMYLVGRVYSRFNTGLELIACGEHTLSTASV